VLHYGGKEGRVMHMIRSIQTVAVVGLLAGVGCSQPPPPQHTPPVPPPPVNQPVNPDSPPIAEFNRRIKEYIAFRESATAGVPPLKRTDDQKEIAARETALGDAVRAARANAKPGDLIPPETAEVFRALIKKDYATRTSNGQKVMRDEIPNFAPKINQTYPSAWPLATFPATLLAALPELPEGIEYRLLSDALILRDVKANIIIDVIRDVF
jgi:hypothetical protein